MKTKKLKRKLTLEKQTIAHINDGEMNVIRGGWPSDAPLCVTVEITCENTCHTCQTCGTCGTVCGGSCGKTICA